MCDSERDKEGDGAEKDGQRHARLQEETGRRENQETPRGEEPREGRGESSERASETADRPGKNNSISVLLIYFFYS